MNVLDNIVKLFRGTPEAVVLVPVPEAVAAALAHPYRDTDDFREMKAGAIRVYWENETIHDRAIKERAYEADKARKAYWKTPRHLRHTMQRPRPGGSITWAEAVDIDRRRNGPHTEVLDRMMDEELDIVYGGRIDACPWSDDRWLDETAPIDVRWWMDDTLTADEAAQLERYAA